MKVRAVWSRMTGILSREGARPRVSIFFFKAAVQSMLLLGAEMWVVTPPMVQAMGDFQDQVVRQMTGWLPQRRLYGIWEYTSVEVA